VALCDAAADRRRAARDRARPAWDARFRPAPLRLRYAHGGRRPSWLRRSVGVTENGPIDVVGHDIGAWIGYAYAAEWPDDVKRLAVFDAALPGITPLPPAAIPSAEVNVKTWHFAFNRLDDLPERHYHIEQVKALFRPRLVR
jgi:pimeloyl-ACP methyl ester carboxylesterase